MGSIVVDAANSFFAPQHSFYDSRRERVPEFTPARPEGSMSAPEHMAPDSSSVRSVPRTYSSTNNNNNLPRSPSQRNAQRPVPATPESPSLQPDATPPPDMDVPMAMDTPTMRPRRSSGPAKIKVRDLEHIQALASENSAAFSEISMRSRSRSRAGREEGPQYEISEMKVEHIIEMVAGLLTKITTTNDQQHEHLHRHTPQVQTGSHLSSQTNSVLAFHGKNVPSITILSYLSRINKYCPTSYEVFLSLLVYFDRMTERVNAGPMQSLRRASEAAMERRDSIPSSSGSSAGSDEMEGLVTAEGQQAAAAAAATATTTTTTTTTTTQTVTPPASGELEKGEHSARPGTPHSRTYQADSPQIAPQPPSVTDYNLSHFFVVDSFNIHRLVIAGVTCASKFFSDIFYTNSRYAKVGGLPLPELNHLELQFLLLNDFRLSIPVEEIEAYGTMLVEFYAREFVAQRRAAEAEAAMQMRSLSASSSDSAVTVQGP